MTISTTIPSATTPLYASDEDIAVRAGGDFLALCPPWQISSAGTDGVFANGFPWVLTSASVNFATNGVRPNQVILLTKPPSNFPGAGHILAIDSVVGGAITLRRLHADLYVGQPPAPMTGLTGVSFSIPTLIPQIEEASFDLKRRYGINELIASRASAYVYDLRVLRMAAVLTVLLNRYTQECRTDRGDFARKIELIRSELGDVEAGLSVRWGASGAAAAPSSLFGARISR
jgi:hypothetical protein